MARGRADVQVREDDPAHRVDGIGERVETVEHREPRGRPATGNIAPEKKNIGMIAICMSAMKDCICVMRAATITPKAVIANASSSSARTAR